ncbi:anillin-like isoform X2 [Anthonomus grandis grandis]|uniref:anillin-like isoform X2 n=1 Tax=Anthonomus grandis grandis TaxID=2921223 RepID=UPI002166A4E0|nr:anillin-like isoform X2 [Anthonomus grandis grandis]
MDAFTENILARARERQRLLQGLPVEEKLPLKESNRIAVSEPNLKDLEKIPQKEVKSETDLRCKESSTVESVPLGHFTRQNSITRVLSDVQGSPGQQTKFLNIQRDNFNMEIKVNSADNVRLQVEIEERSDESNDASEEQTGLREESKNRLKRLGKLYAGGEDADISSPIHRTEAKFYQSIQEDKNKENREVNAKGKKGLSKLADLADTINQWEDELSHPSRPTEKKAPASPKKTWKPPAPQPPTASPQKGTPSKPLKQKAPSPPAINSVSPKKALFQRQGTFTKEESVTSSPKKIAPEVVSVYEKSSSPVKESVSPTKEIAANQIATKELKSSGAGPKHISWDRSVLDTLESQGFQRTQSSSRLVYAYNSQENAAKPPEVSSISEEPQEKPESPKTTVKTPDSPSKNFRSGAIANRAAMFESKTVQSPVKPGKDPAMLSLAERKALFEKNKGDALVPKAAFGMSAPVKVDTTMKACESKFIGASKNNVQSSKSTFELQGATKTQDPVVPSASQTPNLQQKPVAPRTPLPELKIIPPPSPKVTPKSQMPAVAVVHQGSGIASKMAALLENKNKSTISEEQIANKMKEERQKELDMLLNRFNKNKEATNKEDEIQEIHSDNDVSSESEAEENCDEKTAMIKGTSAVVVQNQRKSAEKRKSGGSRLSSEADSPQVVSLLEDVKRIKVIGPKAGRLYPNLSDIEATTTDQETRSPTPNEENSYGTNQYDSDDAETSFGRDIMQAVCKNITPTRKVDNYRESSSSENSSLMNDLDEILEEMDEESSTGPTPPKHGRHVSPKHVRPQQSNSFHYKSFTSSSSSGSNSSPSSHKSPKFKSPNKVVISPRQSMDLPLVVEGDNVMTLTHSVSFYRKQQNEVQTPVKKIVRQPAIEEVSENDHPQDAEVQEKIEKLKEEVNRQQNIIAQTSQALNLCSSTPEFSGSTEQVEAERVLLVATNRRQAALHEIQRMKVEGTLRPRTVHSQHLPIEKGTLTISNIVLPMKQKYVTALAAAGGKGHHVVCLIKCGEQVVPTKLVSTVASNSKNPDVDLYVPGTVVLNNIYSDFTVTFEVYCLQAQEECLPHEVKYHINKKGSKGTTPKKNKQESRLVRPPKESPGGPQAVRSSSFALMGYVVFSVQAVSKKVWSLNNTPPMSPLEGSVEMKIHCELAVTVEHRAFLTMFEDISGFGAWHRRWCLLKGHTLSYWKYPEDEKKMAPIDTIDLHSCVTKTVGPVSREICARLHTFLLERERPVYPQDKDSLVVLRRGDKTVIRHLLSADTKEERIEWCQKINAALTAIRMWGNPPH